MTKVDFYILDGVGASRPEVYLCRLLEKIYLKGHRCYIYQPEPSAAKQLDQLLWTFREGSFIPHQQQSSRSVEQTDQSKLLNVITIGTEQPADHDDDDVLINMALEVPEFFGRFQRLVEIVGNNTEQKNASRSRYRYYRDRGYPLGTHKITIQ